MTLRLSPGLHFAFRLLTQCPTPTAALPYFCINASFSLITIQCQRFPLAEPPLLRPSYPYLSNHKLPAPKCTSRSLDFSSDVHIQLPSPNLLEVSKAPLILHFQVLTHILPSQIWPFSLFPFRKWHLHPVAQSRNLRVIFNPSSCISPYPKLPGVP